MIRRATVCLLVGLAGTLAGAEVHGVVYDENGDIPLAKITIFADGQGTKLTTTDSQGRFTVPIPDGEKGRWIVVWREDVIGSGYWLPLSQFADQPVRVAVDRGMRLTVRVTDPGGHAIPEAKLDVPTHGTRTGEDGVGVVGPVARHGGVNLSVSATGYEPTSLNGLPALSFRDRELVVVLKPLPGTAPPVEAPPKAADGGGF